MQREKMIFEAFFANKMIFRTTYFEENNTLEKNSISKKINFEQ